MSNQKQTPEDQTVSLSHQAEQINTSVGRILKSFRNEDMKRTAYWSGVAGRQLSDLIKEVLSTMPEPPPRITI